MVSRCVYTTPISTTVYHYNRTKEYREYDRMVKQQVFEHYGEKCKCCDESRSEFLTIDHINGGGRKHMKLIKTTLYKDLRRNNFPLGYRVLCMNCNHALGHYGYCPHRKGKKQIMAPKRKKSPKEDLFNYLMDCYTYPAKEKYNKRTGKRID